jgi:hypothetical protein
MLTPEILRDAADLISPTSADSNIHLFMCRAVRYTDFDAADEFVDLLLEHGVIAMRGDVAHFEFDRESGEFLLTYEQRQASRFMFLEFLALWLEDQ